MKTILGVVVGALGGAALTFAFFEANPPGAAALAESVEKLKNAEFDLAASKKAETRLREKVAELSSSIETSNLALTKAREAQRAMEGAAAAEKADSPDGANNFAEVMQGFGKAQSDHAFNTLVAKLGLEGAALDSFKAVFDAMRSKREAAFAKFLTGGMSFEEMALVEGHTPTVDDWVKDNLDAAAQEEYAAYKADQEVNRIERKANEELTWLTSVASLSPEQKDAAYEIFADHHTQEKPELMLEFDNIESFREVWNRAAGSRRDALGEILDEGQMEVYVQQSDLMAQMVEGFMSSALEQKAKE